MNYIARCLEKFRALPEPIKNRLGGFEVLRNIKKLEEKYDVELSFLVVLAAVGEISLDGISEYAEKKFGFSEEDAFDLRSDMVREVFSLLLFNDEKTIISETELKEEFSKGIVKLLTDNVAAEDINFSVFSLLSRNGVLQENLSNILLENQEVIIPGHIIAEDREVAPTIANWLKDFIKINGSEMFDELKMAEYLSSSPNTKKLNTEEKDLLRKLLRLYRNLVFFPESMGNNPVEDWQIIPVDKVEEDKKINKSNSFQDVLSNEKQAAVQEQTSSGAIASGNLRAQKQVEKKIESAPLNELEMILTQYAPDSLEYKAVKQEIERLKKKK